MAKVTRIKASDGPREEDSGEAVVRKKVSVSDKKTEKEKVAQRRVAEKKVSIESPTTKKSENDGKLAKNSEKSVKKGENSTKLSKKVVQSGNSEKTKKKPFWLFRPFIALWHYFRDAWHELRQVRWPNRKTTWQMVLAVILYSALFMVIISLLDLFFTWLFNLILGN